jgi:hypothetical protein
MFVSSEIREICWCSGENKSLCEFSIEISCQELRVKVHEYYSAVSEIRYYETEKSPAHG